MKLSWSFIFCFCGIHISFAFDEKILKMLPIPKPGGILDMITKPKLPGTGFQVGSQFGANAGGGSFGFGFGFGIGGQSGGQFGGQFGGQAGGQSGGQGDSSFGTGLIVPPKEKQPVKPPGSTWEEKGKDKTGPRPNWGEKENDDEHIPKYDTYKDSKEDNRPDWEEIGEIDKNPKSEYLMDGDLVNDGLIQPRNNKRGKRFIESKIYHVPLTFRSNAKPYQVKIHSSLNSLLEGKSEK